MRTFCIGTGVAILGILVYLLLANDALCVPVGGPPESQSDLFSQKLNYTSG